MWYVDERNKAKRKVFLELLEQEGFTFIENGERNKETITDSVLPLAISFTDKTIDRIENAKKALPLIHKKQLKSVEAYCDNFLPWVGIDEKKVGYTKEEIKAYFGDWENNPIETMDISQNRKEVTFDEDGDGRKASEMAHSDFAEHKKVRELREFPNMYDYSDYLRSLRFVVWLKCSDKLENYYALFGY